MYNVVPWFKAHPRIAASLCFALFCFAYNPVANMLHGQGSGSSNIPEHDSASTTSDLIAEGFVQDGCVDHKTFVICDWKNQMDGRWATTRDDDVLYVQLP